MANALVPIATTTLASPANNVTFSSIPQTYRDLVLVTYVVSSANYASVSMQFNSDSSTSNYVNTFMRGDSGGASSFTNSGNGYLQTYWSGYGTDWSGISITNIMDYSATDKHKTSITKVTENNTTPNAVGVAANAGIWKSTSAITSIYVAALGYTQNWKTGATFTLYGVRA